MRKVCYHTRWQTSDDNCKPDGHHCVYLLPSEKVVCWHTKYETECNHEPICNYIDGRNVVIRDRNQQLYRIDGQPLKSTDRYDDMWTCRLHNDPFELDYSKCALIIMDMWNKHAFPGCARRVGQLAPAINKFADFLRKKGCLIIHSPSDTRFYNIDNPDLSPEEKQARQNTLDVYEKNKWKRACYAYLGNRSKPAKFDYIIEYKNEWPAESNEFTGKSTRENAAIEIESIDALSGDFYSGDNSCERVDAYGEILALTQDRPNLIFVGVHTNMCILGRPNGIRTMTEAGKSIWVVRDLTDVATGGSISGLTKYAAQVDGTGDTFRNRSYNHFEATDLVVDWIGRNIGSETWTSTKVTNKPRFRFSGSFGDDANRVWPRTEPSPSQPSNSWFEIIQLKMHALKFFVSNFFSS